MEHNECEEEHKEHEEEHEEHEEECKEHEEECKEHDQDSHSSCSSPSPQYNYREERKVTAE